MPFIAFQQINVVPGVPQNAAALTQIGAAQRAQLQATGGADIRYTMDNATNPTAAIGMELVVGNPPEWFEKEDLERIRFIAGGAPTTLSVHYYRSGPN